MTFHEVHLVIQQVFDFDNEHIYVLYWNKLQEWKRVLFNPSGESGEYEDLTVQDVEIYKGQQFGYLTW